MELLYPNAASRDYRYCTYTLLDHTRVQTHVKSISLIRAASQQSFQLCLKKKKEKEKRKKKERTRTAPMTKWIFNGTLHLLFERWKIEVEAASQLIKGSPLQFGLVTRLLVTFGQFLRDRGSNKGSISVKKRKKEDRKKEEEKRRGRDDEVFFRLVEIPFTRSANRRRRGGRREDGRKNRRRSRKRKRRAI